MCDRPQAADERFEYFAHREDAAAFLEAEGFTFEHHEPWAFSSGGDFYSATGGWRAGLMERSEAQRLKSRQDARYVVQVYRR